MAETLDGKEQILRVNIDADPELSAGFEVQGTPTFIMFMDGRELERVEGIQPTLASVMAVVTQPFDIPNGMAMTELIQPLLLFDGACSVCDRIGHWVQKPPTAARGLRSWRRAPSATIRPNCARSIPTSLSGMSTPPSIC